jgi:hypothetical protein
LPANANPSSDPTLKTYDLRGDEGNISELAATTFVATLVALLSVETIGYKGEQRSGGEGVSQSRLKGKAFSNFSGQSPPLELRPKTGVSPYLFLESIVVRPNPVVSNLDASPSAPVALIHNRSLTGRRSMRFA